MLKFYVWGQNALHSLRNDRDGVVSLEYVIVAAAICGVVITAFSATGPLGTALTGALTSIGTAIATATG